MTPYATAYFEYDHEWGYFICVDGNSDRYLHSRILPENYEFLA